MEAALTSGDLARATGHTVRAVRHYEEEGLLAPSEVSDGGRRRYTAADLERLRLIVDLRELGLSCSEIRSILELEGRCSTAGEFAAELRQVLEGHLAEAQRRLERLRRMRRELLASLELVEERLRGHEGHGCPCEVAAADEAPRIVKVLLGHRGCGCAEAGAGHHHGPLASRRALSTEPGQAFPSAAVAGLAAAGGDRRAGGAGEPWSGADDVPAGHA
jgi:DNA-binding transcriptional MerR regulator